MTDLFLNRYDILALSEEGHISIDSSALSDFLEALNAAFDSELSDAEITGVLFMREEEKLARDGYAYGYLIDIKEYQGEVEGNADIVLVYENLLKGSRTSTRLRKQHRKPECQLPTPLSLPEAVKRDYGR